MEECRKEREDLRDSTQRLEGSNVQSVSNVVETRRLEEIVMDLRKEISRTYPDDCEKFVFTVIEDRLWETL